MAERVADFPVDTWTFDDLEERLDERFPHGDWDIKLDVAKDCCWSATVRVTPHPNRPSAPDRSYVTHSVAGNSPEEVAQKAVAEALRWADEMPVGWFDE